MQADLFFKIAVIGMLLAVLNQLLVRSGREEQAMMANWVGLLATNNRDKYHLISVPKNDQTIPVIINSSGFNPLLSLFLDHSGVLCTRTKYKTGLNKNKNNQGDYTREKKGVFYGDLLYSFGY